MFIQSALPRHAPNVTIGMLATSDPGEGLTALQILYPIYSSIANDLVNACKRFQPCIVLIFSLMPYCIIHRGRATV